LQHQLLQQSHGVGLPSTTNIHISDFAEFTAQLSQLFQNQHTTSRLGAKNQNSNVEFLDFIQACGNPIWSDDIQQRRPLTVAEFTCSLVLNGWLASIHLRCMFYQILLPARKSTMYINLQITSQLEKCQVSVVHTISNCTQPASVLLSHISTCSWKISTKF